MKLNAGKEMKLLRQNHDRGKDMLRELRDKNLLWAEYRLAVRWEFV